MQKYLLTTIAGLETLARKEIERLGIKILEVQDRSIYFQGNTEDMIRANIWSRFGNKVYEILEEKENIDNFDKLFDLVYSVDWNSLIKREHPIITKAISIKSDLTSTPAIQSICKKAIIKKLNNGKEDFRRENPDLGVFEISILLKDNKARVLLNTSGEALHKRGYRLEAGEAPIKENLGAALVMLSNWNFKEPFYDFFSGSGTIPIEASLIAHNIAPGLNRKFAFEELKLVKKDLVEEIRNEAKAKEFKGNYQINGYDIDPDMIDIAIENAKRAGVEDSIIFEIKDFKKDIPKDLKGTLVSNPPYGKRLTDEDMRGLYKMINDIFIKNKDLNGGVITGYEGFDDIIKRNDYKKRKLYNGRELAYFYKKVNKK